ncbi:hypothetical protein HAX54_024970 [Datura stramonium]|uniref:Uncharacterized protein n=1 Tax=Datura stramonium TaxID=4076 RepID=A0ABS8S623_DATST|nr:hypothetical protein [Datura stramonium]
MAPSKSLYNSSQLSWTRYSENDITILVQPWLKRRGRGRFAVALPRRGLVTAITEILMLKLIEKEVLQGVLFGHLWNLRGGSGSSKSTLPPSKCGQIVYPGNAIFPLSPDPPKLNMGAN